MIRRTGKLFTRGYARANRDTRSVASRATADLPSYDGGHLSPSLRTPRDIVRHEARMDLRGLGRNRERRVDDVLPGRSIRCPPKDRCRFDWRASTGTRSPSIRGLTAAGRSENAFALLKRPRSPIAPGEVHPATWRTRPEDSNEGSPNRHLEPIIQGSGSTGSV